MVHFEVNWLLKERFIKYQVSVWATNSGKEINLNGTQFGILCKIRYFVLTKELPSLKLLNNYFDSMIDFFIKWNWPINTKGG